MGTPGNNRPISITLAAMTIVSLIIILAVFVWQTSALAQGATPTGIETPAPTPAPAAAPKPPERFYLEVDQADLATISQALNELPKKIADPMILKLSGQLQAQAKIIEAKAAAEKADRADIGKRTKPK